MSLAAGTRLGPYEIVSPLGAGGMGEVYRARDPRLERTVAIKILPEGLGADQQLRDRFEREARALSTLDHPHICAIYDVGELRGRAYLVMQYLEGETLAARLVRGPLSVDEVLSYGAQIADALDKAHRAGIVHRDLKPGNIFLATVRGHRHGHVPAPTVKLLDFGLAKTSQPVFGSGDPSNAATTPTGVTVQGAIVGTLQYMAPEQVEGREADARTDIFAFGAVLFEMLTGRKAFEGGSAAALIGAILKDEPPAPSTLAPRVPSALDHVVVRCLEKDPDQRWQTSADLLGELQWLLENASAREVSARGRRAASWRTVWALATVAVIASAAAVFFATRGAERPPSESRRLAFSVLPPQAWVLGPNNGQSIPSVSPDGRQVAFVLVDEFNRASLWVRPLASSAARMLEGTEGAQFPFWSPDSREIAFFADGQLKAIDSGGGPARSVCPAAGARGGSWGSGETILFATLQGGLSRVTATGGDPQTVLPAGQSAAPLFPAFLPDGRRFLYYDAGAGGVWMGELDGAPPGRVLAADSQALYLASGHLLYTQQGMLLRQPFDPERRQTSGAAETVAERIAMDTTGAAGFSATGDVLVYRTGTFAVTTQLQWADRNGRMLGAVGPPGRHRNPALSPDDTRVAVETLAPGATTHDIWVIEVVRGAASRLTLDPADDTLPRWLPDGRRIVFRSTRGGRPGLYLKAADGTGSDTLIASGPADGSAPPLTGWSPTRDGQGVVVTRGEPEPGIAVLPLQGGTPDPVELTTLTRVLPEVSPDGRWLLYNSNESGRWEVYVQGYRNGAPRQQISTDGGVRPRWDKTGREVFYMAPGGRLMAAPISGTEDLSVGNPLFLFEPGTLLDEGVSPNYFQQFDIARDGRILLNVPLEPVSAAIAVVVNWAQADADTR